MSLHVEKQSEIIQKKKKKRTKFIKYYDIYLYILFNLPTLRQP